MKEAPQDERWELVRLAARSYRQGDAAPVLCPRCAKPVQVLGAADSRTSTLLFVRCPCGHVDATLHGL